MTVCAAAIYGAGYVGDEPSEQGILCISDLMLTSGDIEFETDHSKIYFLIPNRAVALGSGEVDLHMTLTERTFKKVMDDGIVNVGPAAEVFSDNFISLRRKRAEGIYLAPLGLDLDAFISQQSQMNPEIARDLTANLLHEELAVSSIIAGMDTDASPHIYGVEDPGTLICHDRTAFCAIGSGARQFESLFMSAAYTRAWPWHAAMLLMYSAKKKAEVSPGVGKETDLFIIDKEGIHVIEEDAMAALDEYYNQSEKAAEETRTRILESMINDDRLFEKEVEQQPNA